MVTQPMFPLPGWRVEPTGSIDEHKNVEVALFFGSLERNSMVEEVQTTLRTKFLRMGERALDPNSLVLALHVENVLDSQDRAQFARDLSDIFAEEMDVLLREAATDGRQWHGRNNSLPVLDRCTRSQSSITYYWITTTPKERFTLLTLFSYLDSIGSADDGALQTLAKRVFGGGVTLNKNRSKSQAAFVAYNYLDDPRSRHRGGFDLTFSDTLKIFSVAPFIMSYRGAVASPPDTSRGDGGSGSGGGGKRAKPGSAASSG